jgi:hypothetical protein
MIRTSSASSADACRIHERFFGETFRRQAGQQLQRRQKVVSCSMMRWMVRSPTRM